MLTAVIHPVLLVPGGYAPDADVEALRAVLQRMQAWWETEGQAWVLLADPKAPHCPEPWEWFANYPGGPVYAAQDWAWRHGFLPDDTSVKALLFVQGYQDGHGVTAGRTAIVGYQAVDRLRQQASAGGFDLVHSACGLIQHEVGHLLGLPHLNEPHELMNGEDSWWTEWPDCRLSQRPALEAA